MFDFDVGKLVIVGVVALIVVGPKDLPRVLRQVGQIVGKMRRMASEFQGQFMEAMREADVEDLKKDLEKATDAVKLDSVLDPLRDTHDEIKKALESEPGAPAAEEPVASAVETMDAASPPAIDGLHPARADDGALEPPAPEPVNLAAAEKTADAVVVDAKP